MGQPNDPLGAFCRENPIALEPTGRGPLTGLSFAVKDAMDIAGHRTGFGQPLWLATHEPATAHAELVAQLLDAGARMLGVTVTDELTYSLSGENVHYGTPVNPRCPGRVAGGSSSGSASAVAGGLVDFSIGTDCAGSVRLPASYCGILGMRPSHGRVSKRGVLPFSPSLDAVGWFARDPVVLESVGRVLLADPSRPDLPRRLLIASDGFAMVDARVRDALRPAVERLRREFPVVEEVTVAQAGLQAWMECFRVIQAREIWQSLGPWVSSHRPQFGPGIRERFEIAERVTDADVDAARTERKAIEARIGALIGARDVLTLPTSPRIAPLRNTATDTMEITYRYQAMCLLSIAGIGGLPQLSLPAAELDGCPLGLSIVGAKGRDLELLALARRVR